MISQEILDKAHEFFPGLKLRYKDESTLMKIMGKLMFFNPSFMTQFTTTIGETIYFPSKKFETVRPVSSLVIFLHELIHVYDAKKYTGIAFSFLYLFPQILSILLLPMLFVSWMIFLPIIILCALPIPAYFRMYFEKRAYLVSLYSYWKLSNKKQFKFDIDNGAHECLQYFKGPAYYFTWIFNGLDKEFAAGVELIKNGKRPYEDPVFDMIDKIIEVC